VLPQTLVVEVGCWWGRQEMRRANLLGLACAAVAVSVLASRATDRDRPGSAGAAATPPTLSAWPSIRRAGRVGRSRCRSRPPARLALVGSRLLIASREARSVGAAEVRGCRWLGTIAVLPSQAKVSPPPPQAGVINGPDRPYGLAADRHSLWVVGELTLYRYDLAGGRLTARVPLPGLAVALTPGVLWAANLVEGSTFVYGIDARTATIRSKGRGDSEIVAMTAGAGAVWAVSHDRATLLRIDPRSGRVARRIPVASDPHGVAFGSGFVWVALYHQSTIVRVDPDTTGSWDRRSRLASRPSCWPRRAGSCGRSPRPVATWPTPSCTPCWRSTPKAAASWAPTTPAAALRIWWRPATASGWRPPSRTSSSASPAQARPELMAERSAHNPG
jgi:hypothetical protein